MSSFRRVLLLQGLKLFDLFIIVVAFSIAAFVASTQTRPSSVFDFLSLRITIQNFLIFLGVLVVCSSIFTAIGLYHSKRLSRSADQVLDLLKAVAACSVVVFTMANVFDIQMITGIFLVAFCWLMLFLLVSSRVALKFILSWFRVRGRNLRHVLVIGTNPKALQFAGKIKSRPELGYHLIGFVNERRGCDDAFGKLRYSLVCNLDEFAEFIRRNIVDEVVLGLSLESHYRESSKIIKLCEQHGIIVRLLADIFDLKLARMTIEEFEDEAFVTVYTGKAESWQILLKRMLDFSLALCLLILMSPILFIVGLAIKLTSPGPILFVQERVGLNKRTFSLYKFRTMVTDAEQRLAELEHLNEVSGPVFKIVNDPRVTPMGRILRKTSIDELPQLVNVLRGDMSLVGPRPLPVRDYNGFDRDWYRRRFTVRPGITCLWQINGRSDTPFKKWMELDMEYIDRWSLWLDFKILVKTLPAVMRGTGAA